ncbi:MAG: hypothetical protein H0X46_00465 [Bacteroidetes bacterium]|nr:hypothetical protein [Bacteroidota bacterium]
MIHKNTDIDLRPIIDELKNIDIDETDNLFVFLRDSADYICDAADVITNAKLLDHSNDKVFIDRLDTIHSQIRELKLLLYKMDHEAHYFDRLFNVLGALEEEIKRVQEV